MKYFIYSAEQNERREREQGSIAFYDSPKGPVRFTEQNTTGKSSFPDARVVGVFADDKVPETNLVVTNSARRDAWLKTIRTGIKQPAGPNG